MSKQTEYSHKGYVIQQVQYNGTFDNRESLGFAVAQAYRVVDDFGDPALPTTHQLFWTPTDAAAAIDCVNHFEAKAKNPKWATTAAYEFNIVLCYRRNFWHVYDALQRVKQECIDARDFDENPREKVLSILNTLHQYVVAEAR